MGKDKTLFAGPWTGEFGWELLCFQGWIRKIARNSDFTRVVVSSYDHRAPLYADFATDFVAHPFKGTPAGDGFYRWRGVNKKQFLADRQKLVDKYKPDRWVKPDGHKRMNEQRFIKFGEPREELRCDLVIHARARGFDSKKNTKPKTWEKAMERLKKHDLRIVAVGQPKVALCPDGAEDKRGIPLNQLMDVMSSATLVAGPSSGPMHLASLCGATHLVWGDTRRWTFGPLKDRYKTLWNPLSTPVRYVGMGWDPKALKIHDEIMADLDRLRDSGDKQDVR